MRALLTTFTEPFLMSVLFGMIASIILTLPILGILYHRRNRLEFSTVLSVYLSIWDLSMFVPALRRRRHCVEYRGRHCGHGYCDCVESC